MTRAIGGPIGGYNSSTVEFADDNTTPVPRTYEFHYRVKAWMLSDIFNTYLLLPPTRMNFDFMQIYPCSIRPRLTGVPSMSEIFMGANYQPDVHFKEFKIPDITFDKNQSFMLVEFVTMKAGLQALMVNTWRQTNTCYEMEYTYTTFRRDVTQNTDVYKQTIINPGGILPYKVKIAHSAVSLGEAWAVPRTQSTLENLYLPEDLVENIAKDVRIPFAYGDCWVQAFDWDTSQTEEATYSLKIKKRQYNVWPGTVITANLILPNNKILWGNSADTHRSIEDVDRFFQNHAVNTNGNLVQAFEDLKHTNFSERYSENFLQPHGVYWGYQNTLGTIYGGTQIGTHSVQFPNMRVLNSGPHNQIDKFLFNRTGFDDASKDDGTYFGKLNLSIQYLEPHPCPVNIYICSDYLMNGKWWGNGMFTTDYQTY